MHRFLVSTLLLCLLAVPAAAEGGSGTASRFKALARDARATGSLALTVEFSGEGRVGAVAVGLRLDDSRRIKVRNGYVVLPVEGRMQAKVRPSEGGETCTANRTLDGIALTIDDSGRGILLRPGTGPDDSGVPDPFSSACPGPSLGGLGEPAMPALRLLRLGRAVDRLSLRFKATRFASSGGYEAKVTTRGTVRLAKPR